MAGACWALPMPLVTSQTYVPKNNLITWINNYHYEYVLKLSYYIWINNYHYEYVPASSDLIGEMMRAPSGWMVTRPLGGRDHYKENEDQNYQIVSINYQLSELKILWWWSWSLLSSLAASGALLSLCMTSIWKQNTAWKWKQTRAQDQNIVTAI